VTGYLELPEGWERMGSEGPKPFVTAELLRRPDGSVVRWESRSHRKSAPGRHRPSRRRESVWWRPHRRSWWMAVLFAIGSICFAAGGVEAQWSLTSASVTGVTFFVGSIFFTSAAYLQYSEAVNVDHAVGERKHRWRPASWEPGRIDWLASLIQLIGTVLFNISTFAAMNTNLTTHQINARVWAPDVFGSIAFLLSSELAYAEVCHRWACFRNRTLSWKVVALNLAGSIFFGISAVASLVQPATGHPVSAVIANAGTSLGGLCFLAGAVLLMPESAQAERTAQSAPAAAGQAAAAPS
jgi:hypothetical protein